MGSNHQDRSNHRNPRGDHSGHEISRLTHSNSETDRACERNRGQSEKDFEHIKEIDRKIAHLEEKTDSTQKQIEEVNEGIKKIGRSQISLLRHMVDGNGVDKMRDEAEELTDFFIDR